MEDGIRAAVICAFHNGNAGMFSVDMAARQFLNKIGIPFDLFVAQTKSGESFHKYGDMKFKVIRSQDDLKGYSHILYWGDFLNNPIYGKGGFSHQDVALGNSKENGEAFKFWKDIMMPDRRRIPDAKIFSVSNNFQGIDKTVSRDVSESISEYFIKGFNYVFPRDPFSLESLENLYPYLDKSRLIQGVDSAYLWDAREEFNITNRNKLDYFSYFFGRSKIENFDELISSVERATGLEARPLSGWLSCRPAPQEIMKGFISQISESHFVISDTYHCCVNTMNIGTPIIGVGRAVDEQKGTLGDYKKKVLFDMFGLSSRYTSFSSAKISSIELEEIILTALNFSRSDHGSAEFDFLKAKKAIYFEKLKSCMLE